MPAGRVSMRHVREILRLGCTGISGHEIARRTGLAPSTVRETLKRFEDSGLTWPLPDEVTDGALEARLYKNAGTKQGHRRQVEPDWAIVHRELKRKHVTLSILWDEYIEQHPGGYRYSRFCDLYRSWEGKLSVTMRQAHAGGEKLFVDYDLDRPMLKPLPVEPYMFAEWRIRRVGIDYHVDVDRHYYSVPYRFAKDQVEVRLTARTVELFAKGERIAAHLRASGNGKHTTVQEHMPSSHRRYADWTIDRIRRDAKGIGPSAAALCDLILDERSHPEQGFRACLGIVRLVKAFGAPRVEAAATRALDIGARTYGSVKSILDNNLDRHAATQRAADGVTILHRNIRGSRYYH